ncbi:phosphopantothenate/pantothenate synthetase [Candidatus Bathyarchaeota archaeon]|nr:MAG: phosphopantothenate/pantothenate synthetase [Candidatus Bathyarchaeota archaeon]
MCRTNVSTVVPPRHPTRLDGHQIQHDDARRVGVLHGPKGSSSARDNTSSKARHDSICFPYSEIGGAPALIVSPHHPRFLSLATRERLEKAMRAGIVVPQGLIAHGRGEAFDYILGEETLPAASAATSAAAALLLTAKHPVVSVNGNTAALAGREIVNLSLAISAPIEVNLFHRTRRRERLIAAYLKRLGSEEVLGIGEAASNAIRGIASQRRRTDPRGIGQADVVLIPLEDGDRAEALSRDGKKVIAIDLNPLSRTSRAASVSIVDNVIRAIPALTDAYNKMKKMPRDRLERLASEFDNQRNLAKAIQEMIQYLRGWA